ncbi:hypothetical protein [Paraburkholderia sp. RL17-337-BIB-A]|uniref:hypothetical protein n=1 Tax=Paraburkholderia sp. RL17-337-BIB-A TaxID=3031636 RepID=UPI0038BD8435
MKLCKYLSVSIFAVAISNFSYASPVGQTLSCPSVAQIKEMCDHKGGCFYEAIAANGQKWRGENPMGSKGGVATFAFNEDISGMTAPKKNILLVIISATLLRREHVWPYFMMYA